MVEPSPEKPAFTHLPGGLKPFCFHRPCISARAGRYVSGLRPQAAHRRGMSDEDIERENDTRAAFLDWLLGVLDIDPETRWTPAQARLRSGL